MDEREALDRETFAQVWSRVSPKGEGPVEVIPPAGGPGEDAGARQLQELVLTMLTDASVYRDLSRRSRRSVAAVTGLGRLKTAQARRLGAAYFLMTGVRYWPAGATPVNPPEGFFPALRERFLAEGRLAGQLESLAAQAAGPDLRALYQDLAQETRELTRTIRSIVERET